jgi:CO dehydrogenase maturation factor
MAFTIAVSGKGGTGKTSLAALIVRHLVKHVRRAVLAVDADPNSTLAQALGVEVTCTVADIREDAVAKRLDVPEGASRERHIEYCIQQSILECHGFDLLTMGRPEGPGCYCYVNHLLRGCLDVASGDYPFVVIDNEAGMEHLSRRTTTNVDVLFIVAEPTVVSAESALRVADAARKLPIRILRPRMVINKVPDGGLHPNVIAKFQSAGLNVDYQLPYDPALVDVWATGTPVMELPDDSPSVLRVAQMMACEMSE